MFVDNDNIVYPDMVELLVREMGQDVDSPHRYLTDKDVKIK